MLMVRRAGGSTIVCLFEKDAMEWDEDLLNNSRACLETHTTRYPLIVAVIVSFCSMQFVLARPFRSVDLPPSASRSLSLVTFGFVV